MGVFLQRNKTSVGIIGGLFAIAIFGFGVFVFAAVDKEKSSLYPDPRMYAPNFWFDSTEQYYPTTPFFYTDKYEEISGSKSKDEYEKLSLEQKTNLFIVYYNVLDEGNKWVYQYWLYYAYDLFTNEHWHDWESLFVYVDKNTKKVSSAIGSAHGNLPAIFENISLKSPSADHLWLYIEGGSHAVTPDDEPDGLPSPVDTRGYDMQNWDQNDKKFGLKVNYPDYSLEKVTPEFILKFNDSKAFSNESAPQLGLNVLKALNLDDSNVIKLVGLGDSSIHIKFIAGDPPTHPWTKKEFVNTQEALPATEKFAIGVKESISGAADAWQAADKKVASVIKQSVSSTAHFLGNIGNISIGGSKNKSASFITTSRQGEIQLELSDNKELSAESPQAGNASLEVKKNQPNTLANTNKLASVPAAPKQSDIQKPTSQTSTKTYRAARVVDGDTLVLDTGETVRYVGVDAPEAKTNGGDCYAEEAKAENESLVLGVDLRFENGPEDKDIYGRLLRYVYANNVFVNQTLIGGGFARAYDFGHPHSFSNTFKDAETKAKAASLGLWGNTCAAKPNEADVKSDEKIVEVPKPAPAAKIILNEVKIDNGEFVELYNPTSAGVSLSGYYFAYYSSSRTDWASPWRVKQLPENASIIAGGYYLISFEDGVSGADWQPYTSAQLSNSAGTVALFWGDPQVGGSARADAFGWGETSLFESQSFKEFSAAASSSFARGTQSSDTDINNIDFRVTTLVTPRSQNLISALQTNEAPAAPLQGTGGSDAAPANIIINEVQVNDSEFVELYNPGSSPANLTGHYFSYYSSSKTVWNDPYRNKQFPDGASVPAGGYYLIGLNGYPAEGGNPNADWQPYATAQLANTAGTVAIFPFDPATKNSIDAQSGIIDAVGWGAVTLAEPKSSPAPALTPEEGKSVTRNSTHADTNNNQNDFTVTASPTPKAGNAVAGDTTAPAVVLDLAAVSGSTRGSINIAWTAVGDDGNIGTATGYTLKYGAVAITEENWASATVYAQSLAPKVVGEAEGLTLTGLTPGTLYFFALKVKDEADNYSTLSNVPSVKANATADHLLINEVQVADSEFVELYNPTASVIPLAGYHFTYYSSTKINWNDPYRNKTFPASGSVSAGGYYLIGLKGYAISNSNPNADWQPYTSAQLSNSAGTVAVFSSDPALGTAESPILPIDAASWGSDASVTLKEAQTASAPAASKSSSRDSSHWDSENNNADFTVLDTPTPTNSGGAAYSSSFSATPLLSMLYGDARHSGKSSQSGPSWTSSEQVASPWQVSLAVTASAIGAPVIDSDGNIYITGESKIYSYNSAGAERWNYTTSAPDLQAPALSPDSSMLYVVSTGVNTAGSEGQLYILNTADGAVLAELSLGVTWGLGNSNHMATSPVLDSAGNVYTCTLRQCIAFDKDGGQIWATTPDWGSIISASYSGTSADTVRVPVILNNVLYVFMNSPNGKYYLFAFDAGTGAILWQKNEEQSPSTGITSIESDPSINENGKIYAGYAQSGGYGVAAFDTTASGAFLWKLQLTTTKRIDYAPLLRDANNIYAKSSLSTQVFLVQENAGVPGSQLLFTSGGNVGSSIVYDALNRLYLGDASGAIYALNALASPVAAVWQYQLATGETALRVVMGEGVMYAITSAAKIYKFGL